MEIYVEEINKTILDQYIINISNDEHALSELYNLTSKRVYGFILSMLKNKHDAEDVLHDTYISIYHSSQSYESTGKPMAWILGIARNLALLKLRENKKSTSIAYEDFEENIDYQQDISIEDKLVIREFMEILSLEEREIIYLHDIAGFKHREIAHLLHIALPTVLSKYHRSIKKLRIKYEEGVK